MEATAVPRVGVTGHTDLSEQTKSLVFDEIVDLLRGQGPVHGYTCLAAGADRVFAEAVVAVGGTYDVLLPLPDYRDRVVPAQELAYFDALVAGAEETIVISDGEPPQEAYRKANAELVRRSDQLIAVWDGRPDPRPGSTAHAVALAAEAALPVIRIWPAEAERTMPGWHQERTMWRWRSARTGSSSSARMPTGATRSPRAVAD